MLALCVGHLLKKQQQIRVIYVIKEVMQKDMGKSGQCHSTSQIPLIHPQLN